MQLWRAFTYGIVRTMIRVAMALLTRTSVRGLEHLPPCGAGILACNHIHAIDPAILVGALPRRLMLMSKVENRRGPLRLFMPMVGAFTIRRGTADRAALATAATALARGELLCMFPEGTRSADGCLGAGRGGVAMLAIQSGAPIIPVAVTGTTDVFIRRLPWVRVPRARVTVTLGPPLVHHARPSESRHEERQRLTGEIMARIAGLLPPDRRGSYVEPPALARGIPSRE